MVASSNYNNLVRNNNPIPTNLTPAMNYELSTMNCPMNHNEPGKKTMNHEL
jgi:hypothetical protein